MRQFRTQAIILNRTDYGEADRILTFLTPDQGKVKAIAKGVRRQKSKLAGGIELFSISDLSFIAGKSEINTLRSSRLIKYYADIVKDLDRTDAAYRFIKRLDKATEDSPEPNYFYLLQQTFAALDDSKIRLPVIELWFDMHLLKLAGHIPNLNTDAGGQKLLPGKKYKFEHERMCFAEDGQGPYTPAHIQLLRLSSQAKTPGVLQRVKDVESLIKPPLALVQSLTL